jgi:hypothetical protein
MCFIRAREAYEHHNLEAATSSKLFHQSLKLWISERQHLESLIESTRLWKRAQPKTSCKLHPSGSVKEKPPACLEALEAPTPKNLEYRPWKLMASNKYQPRLDR